MDDAVIYLGIVCIAVFAAAAFIAAIYLGILKVKRWWRSPPMRLFRLGGVTTLEQTLNYPCTLCQEIMVAGDKVRTLSCDHVFHCGGTDRCARDIDAWLLDGEGQLCPLCRQAPRPVMPWKRTPPSSPAQDLEAPLRARAHDQTLPEASSSAPAPPPPPVQPPPPTSTPDSKEALLLPVHWFDEGLPEASSSQ